MGHSMIILPSNINECNVHFELQNLFYLDFFLPVRGVPGLMTMMLQHFFSLKIGACMMKMVQLYPNLMSLRGMKN
jgi:hypothetical protein